MRFSSGVEEFQLRCALDFLVFVGNLPENVYNFAETLRIIFLTDFSQKAPPSRCFCSCSKVVTTPELADFSMETSMAICL